jgi:hypothetical protein
VTVRAAPALLAVVLTSACAGGDDAVETVTVTTSTPVTVTVTTDTATTTTAAPRGGWDGLEEPLPAGGSLPVEEFNAYAESVEEPWEQDLAATVDEFVGRDASTAQSVSFQATSGPEGGGPATASLLLAGLLDDSVQARRYDLGLSRRPDGTWRVDDASWAQRCQSGRGHQAFSPEPCL